MSPNLRKQKKEKSDAEKGSIKSYSNKEKKSYCESYSECTYERDRQTD